MPVYTCAVADCKSVSNKKSQDVKGWTVFPKKKDARRRRLWETRCKRGLNWRATKDHAICSKHFIDWCQGPSPLHPDPELFAYNQWGASRNTTRNTRSSRNTARNIREGHCAPKSNSLPLSSDKEIVPPNVQKADCCLTIDEDVQVDMQVIKNNESTSVTPGM